MNRRSRSLLPLLLLVPLAAGILAPRHADGLPLFARKYNMPCTSCHLAFPRLNDFGMKFRQNGYRLPGALGESPWEDQKSFPLSLVGNVGVDMQDTSSYVASSKKWQHSTGSRFTQNQVEFHTAGTLAKKITFHFDNNFGDVGNGSIVLISGMAFVQFDDVMKDGRLNVKTGVYDAEIPYLSSSRRTTWADYRMPATLAGEGIELNGTSGAWTYALGLINSGRTIGGVAAQSAGTRNLNSLEDPYLWIMRDVGRNEVTARVFMDSQDPRKAGAKRSQHLQLDVSALIPTSRLWVIPDYTLEQFGDADASDLATGIEPITKTIHRGLLEGTYLLDKDGTWLLTGRYELEHNAKTDFVREGDLSTGAVDVARYLNPNCKVALDWTYGWDNVLGDRINEVMALVHIGY